MEPTQNHETPPVETTETPPRTVGEVLEGYWKQNVRILMILLGIWALASLGCGILIADFLNAITIPGTGYPLGFWFAHQGAIVIFVLLILFYCLYMNRLDDEHHKELEAASKDREVSS